MNAAILAHKKLAKFWRDNGLIMNPYDPCVWNKVIDNKQFTTMFHVDNVLMSHDSPRVVTEYIEKLDSSYIKQHKN